MKEIKTHNIKPRCEVAVPGSKSYTHRILIASALSDGICRIENALISEDTQLTAEALRQLGIQIEKTSDNQLLVFSIQAQSQLRKPACVPLSAGMLRGLM